MCISDVRDKKGKLKICHHVLVVYITAKRVISRREKDVNGSDMYQNEITHVQIVQNHRFSRRSYHCRCRACVGSQIPMWLCKKFFPPTCTLLQEERR